MTTDNRGQSADRREREARIARALHELAVLVRQNEQLKSAANASRLAAWLLQAEH